MTEAKDIRERIVQRSKPISSVRFIRRTTMVRAMRFCCFRHLVGT
jgi:hypothetical protein